MIKIGIKYCGGCNPRYDRKNIIEKLIDEYKDLDIGLAKENEIYDLIIILCGCTSCCINHQNLNGQYGKIIICSDNGYIQIQRAINKIKQQWEK